MKKIIKYIKNRNILKKIKKDKELIVKSVISAQAIEIENLKLEIKRLKGD